MLANISTSALALMWRVRLVRHFSAIPALSYTLQPSLRSHTRPRWREGHTLSAIAAAQEVESAVNREERGEQWPQYLALRGSQAYCRRSWSHGASLLTCTHCAHVWVHPWTTYSLIRTYSSNAGRSNDDTNFKRWQNANRATATYMVAVAIAVVGLSYAAVPLYRLFCQASGYGGTVGVADTSEKVEKMVPIRERELTIRFDAGTSAAMQWQFKPHQREIKVVPGETALAFYTARNPTDRAVTGIATYNVIPFEAGLYFNKIQCFCFEEQRLNPNEQVDMPVFFYIDPEFNDDPAMAKVDTITLSYTFFESKEGDAIYLPVPTGHTS